MEHTEDMLDEALEETFPASDPVAVSAEPVIHDHAEFHRFEAELDGETATLRYMLKDGILTLVHTEVPEALRGRGVAFALARFALDFARQAGFQVKVICPTVQRFIDRNPEYADLVTD